jgi:hypothetical protein
MPEQSAVGHQREEFRRARRRAPQTIEAAALARPALLRFEGIDVPRVLDHHALAEAPAVFGDDVFPVHDPDALERRPHDQALADKRMRDRVVVLIEPGVGVLLDADLQPFIGGIGLSRKREELRLLLLERGPDRDRTVLRPRPIQCVGHAPGERLRVQIVEVLRPRPDLLLEGLLANPPA